MQSILVDDAQLIPGSIAVREVGGLGVLGMYLPTGATTPGYMTDTADLPADNLKEFRGEMISHTFPPGVFEWYDDGSFKIAAGTADGVYSFTWRPTVEGLDYALVTHTVTLGSVGVLSIGASLGTITGQIALQVTPPALLSVVGTVDSLISGLSFGVQASVTISAGMNDAVSIMSFYGELAGTVPTTLSLSRQLKVYREGTLDAYTASVSKVNLWEKDPQAHLDYSVDWSDWLADGGPPYDVIANLYVSKSDGVAVTAQAIPGAGVVAVMVKDGVIGVRETVTMRIVTTMGRVDERTITLLIRDQ